MKQFSLALALLALLVLTACGTPGTPNNNGSGGTGSFSNASMKGSYVFHLSGVDLTNNAAPYRQAGVFTADGNGNVTGGTDDLSEASSGASNTTLTGTYTVSSDGTGTIGLNYASGGTSTLGFTLVSSSQLYLIEADTTANASGSAELQDSSAVTSAPSGTFVFRIHTTSGQGSTATVGVMTVASNVITGGNIDVSRAGVASSLTLTSGLFNSPTTSPSLGRGTGTLSDSSGTILSFIYYVIDSSDVCLMISNPGINGLGVGTLQTGAPFTGSPLVGSYAFGSHGDDAYAIGGVDSVGSLSFSGASLTGTYDSVEDGTPLANANITGTIGSYAANGRVALSFVSSVNGATVNQVAWMVSSSQGYLVTASDSTDSTEVEDGSLNLQQSSSFSTASLNGQYAFVMGGFNTPEGIYVDRVGWISFNGSGTASLYEDVNDSGQGGVVAGPFSGTYTVGANGRATATINSVSTNNNDLVFYLVSGSRAYVLQNDSGIQLSGQVNQQ
jgi:hypothetical protein